jgi:hypothetical protein
MQQLNQVDQVEVDLTIHLYQPQLELEPLVREIQVEQVVDVMVVAVVVEQPQ